MRVASTTGASSDTKGRGGDGGGNRSIAAAAAVSPAQVVLQWGMQRGCTVIPKSLAPAPHTHLQANLNTVNIFQRPPSPTAVACKIISDNGGADESSHGAGCNRGCDGKVPSSVGLLTEEQMRAITGLNKDLRCLQVYSRQQSSDEGCCIS